MPDTVPEAPQSFPMSFREYAVTARLSPVLAAGVAAFLGPVAPERTRDEWDRIVAEFRARPVTE